MQLVGLFDLANGALLKWEKSPLHVHETGMFGNGIHEELNPGDVIVADRANGTFLNIALSRSRRADAVFRLHQARKYEFPKGMDDMVVRWERPSMGSRPLLLLGRRMGMLARVHGGEACEDQSPDKGVSSDGVHPRHYLDGYVGGRLGYVVFPTLEDRGILPRYQDHSGDGTTQGEVPGYSREGSGHAPVGLQLDADVDAGGFEALRRTLGEDEFHRDKGQRLSLGRSHCCSYLEEGQKSGHG